MCNLSSFLQTGKRIRNTGNLNEISASNFTQVKTHNSRMPYLWLTDTLILTPMLMWCCNSNSHSAKKGLKELHRKHEGEWENRNGSSLHGLALPKSLNWIPDLPWADSCCMAVQLLPHRQATAHPLCVAAACNDSLFSCWAVAVSQGGFQRGRTDCTWTAKYHHVSNSFNKGLLEPLWTEQQPRCTSHTRGRVSGTASSLQPALTAWHTHCRAGRTALSLQHQGSATATQHRRSQTRKSSLKPMAVSKSGRQNVTTSTVWVDDTDTNIPNCKFCRTANWHDVGERQTWFYA